MEEEIEQLGKIAQTYQAETGKALTKTQLDDLIGDSNLGTKSVEEVVEGLVERSKVTILKETNRYTDYLNAAGKKIRIHKQPQATIKQSIAAKCIKDKIGDRLEGEVGDYIQNELGIDLTDFGNKVKDATGQDIGDIDCATENVLIEVKASMGNVKIVQIKKYTDVTNENYFNFQHKEIVLYVDEEEKLIDNKYIQLIEKIKDMGVKIVYKSSGDDKYRFIGLRSVIK